LFCDDVPEVPPYADADTFVQFSAIQSERCWVYPPDRAGHTAAVRVGAQDVA